MCYRASGITLLIYIARMYCPIHGPATLFYTLPLYNHYFSIKACTLFSHWQSAHTPDSHPVLAYLVLAPLALTPLALTPPALAPPVLTPLTLPVVVSLAPLAHWPDSGLI